MTVFWTDREVTIERLADMKAYIHAPTMVRIFIQFFMAMSTLFFLGCGSEGTIEDEILPSFKIESFTNPTQTDYTNSTNYVITWEESSFERSPEYFSNYIAKLYNSPDCSGLTIEETSTMGTTYSLDDKGLNEGVYSVAVQLKKVNGEFGPEVCSPAIYYDTSLPTATINVVGTFPSNANVIAVNGTCGDGTAANSEVLLCAKASCTVDADFDQSTLCTSDGTYSTNVTAPEGSITIGAKVYDLAGNSEQELQGPFIVDRTLPNLASFNSHLVPVTTGSTSFDFTWTGSDVGLAGLHSTEAYEVQFFDNGTCAAPALNTVTSTSTTYSTTGLSDGQTYTVGVITKDEAGNLTSLSCSQPLTVSVTSPIIAISDPTNSIPANQETFAKTTTVSASISNDAVAVGWCLSETQSTAPTAATCSGTGWVGTRPTNFSFTAGEGGRVVYLWIKDAVDFIFGTNDSITIDTLAPSPLSYSSPAINTEAQTGVTITGSCETGITVDLSGDISSPATTTCLAGSFSQAITFTAGEGTKNIVVSQTDSASNSTSTNRDFVRDNTAPTLAYSSPTANTEAQTGVTITGSCETGITVDLSGDLTTPATTTCPAGSFSQAITLLPVRELKILWFHKPIPQGTLAVPIETL